MRALPLCDDYLDVGIKALDEKSSSKSEKVLDLERIISYNNYAHNEKVLSRDKKKQLEIRETGKPETPLANENAALGKHNGPPCSLKIILQLGEDGLADRQAVTQE